MVVEVLGVVRVLVSWESSIIWSRKSLGLTASVLPGSLVVISTTGGGEVEPVGGLFTGGAVGKVEFFGAIFDLDVSVESGFRPADSEVTKATRPLRVLCVCFARKLEAGGDTGVDGEEEATGVEDTDDDLCFFGWMSLE